MSAAYAKAHFPEILRRVAKGERIEILRYRKPVAVTSPLDARPARRLGMGEGKIKILDPHWADAWSEKQIRRWLGGK